MTAISAREISMTYRVPVRDAGLRAALGSLFRPKYRDVKAVQSLSLESGWLVNAVWHAGLRRYTSATS